MTRRRTTILTELGSVDLTRVIGYFVSGTLIFLNVDGLADRVLVTEPISPAALSRALGNIRSER